MPAVKRFFQRVENAAQRAMILAVSYPARHRAPVALENARRILVVRHDAIGDMVMSTGFFRRIKEAKPGLDVDVLAAPTNASVLAGLPFVRKIFTHKRGDFLDFPRLRRELRAQRYDAVLDGRVILPKLGTDTALAILASGAPRRIGLAGRVNEDVYSDRLRVDPTSHFIEQMAELTRPLGIDPSTGDWSPTLCISASERDAATRLWAKVPGHGPKLLVNVASATAHRRWPMAKFTEALQALRQWMPELRIFVMAPPKEFDFARTVAADVSATPGQPGLREAFAMVEQADVVHTPDTSISHVASAFKTPVVHMALKGMEMFRPYQAPGRCIFHDGLMLQDLPVEPVLAALKDVLTAERVGPAR
jgi:ADP-heptose:LPS heptosyltransferase